MSTSTCEGKKLQQWRLPEPLQVLTAHRPAMSQHEALRRCNRWGEFVRSGPQVAGERCDCGRRGAISACCTVSRCRSVKGHTKCAKPVVSAVEGQDEAENGTHRAGNHCLEPGKLGGDLDTLLRCIFSPERSLDASGSPQQPATRVTSPRSHARRKPSGRGGGTFLRDLTWTIRHKSHKIFW